MPAPPPSPDDLRRWYLERDQDKPLGTDPDDPIAYSPEGVDRLLIWEMLALSPSERLARLQSLVNSLAPYVSDDHT